MFRYLIISLSFIALACTSMRIHALEVKDLYQAKVLVASQDRSHRVQALKSALAAVMLKVGGQASVLEDDVIKNGIKNYNTYVSQYHYVRENVANTQNSHIQTNEPNQKHPQINVLYLVAHFNEDKINTLFQQANLARWGRLRPQVLLWLIDEQGFERRFLSNSSDSVLPQVVNDFSNERGLPLLLPLMDLTDASEIKMSDFWGRFKQPIKEASMRYFSEAIVLMRISNSSLVADDIKNENATDISANENKTNEQTVKNQYLNSSEANNVTAESPNCLLCQKQNAFVLDWSLITDNQQFSQRYQGESKEELLRQGLSDITTLIYQHYALSATLNNDFSLDVVNVDSLQTYTEIFTFLNDLSAVSSVKLISAHGSKRRFNLTLLGSKAALLSSLKLNKKLKQYIDPLAEIHSEDVPLFYWGVNALKDSFTGNGR